MKTSSEVQTGRRKTLPKSARSLLGEAALLFLVLFLPGYLGGSAPVPDPTAAMLQSIVFGLPQALLIVYVLTLQPDLPRGHFGLVRPSGRDAGTAALALAGALALTAPFVAVPALVPAVRALGATGYRWGLRSPMELPLALVFGLTAGYREELYFRAYLMGRFEQAGIPATIGVAASTALFALGHVYEGPLGVAFAAVLGLFFALVFRRTRSLHACAAAHGLLNTALLALGLLAPGVT